MFSMDNLSQMKYGDLQRLAKKHGIKANMKADKLVKALQDFRAQERIGIDDEVEDKHVKKPTPHKASEEVKRKSSVSEVKSNTPVGSTKNTPNRVTPRVTPNIRSSSGKNTPMSGIRRFNKSATPLSSAKKSQKNPTPSNMKSSPSRRSSGRKRSNTYTLAEGTVPSPSVKEMMDSMKGGMSNDEIKETLQNLLDKNAQSSVGDLEKKPESVPTAIPRFAAFAMKRKAEAQKKAITPGNKDWAKIHQREFDKMDSLEDYLEKKRKRTKSISASVKKARLLAEQTKAAVTNLRSCMSPNNKPPQSKSALFKSSPVPHTGVPFVPKVTSIAEITTNFSTVKSPSTKTLKSVTPKAMKRSSSAGKENTRKSPRIAVAKKSLGGDTQIRKSVQPAAQDRKIAIAAPNRKSLANTASRKSVANVEQKYVTPFKLGASFNQTLPLSQSKAKFDLKASLARPVTWKAYTGKLKPVQAENIYRVDPKNVKVQTKDQRRAAMKTHQSQKRHDMQMKRRGIDVK